MHPLLFDGLWTDAEMLDAKKKTAKAYVESLKCIFGLGLKD